VAVTAGKNMNGFYGLLSAVVVANGLPASSIHCSTSTSVPLRRTVLPGFYRPVKDWDFLVLNEGELVAAVELKSQVGSFGNNFNNRSEEAIGMGEDFRVARREGLLGSACRPFVGYLMLLEDAPLSASPVALNSPHFAADEAFGGASYAERYEILCRRLVREGLYDAASLMLSPKPRVLSESTYRELGDDTGLRAFVARLGARVAETASRNP
jgi:hypothetical protein